MKKYICLLFICKISITQAQSSLIKVNKEHIILINYGLVKTKKGNFEIGKPYMLLVNKHSGNIIEKIDGTECRNSILSTKLLNDTLYVIDAYQTNVYNAKTFDEIAIIDNQKIVKDSFLIFETNNYYTPITSKMFELVNTSNQLCTTSTNGITIYNSQFQKQQYYKNDQLYSVVYENEKYKILSNEKNIKIINQSNKLYATLDFHFSAVYYNKSNFYIVKDNAVIEIPIDSFIKG